MNSDDFHQVPDLRCSWDSDRGCSNKFCNYRNTKDISNHLDNCEDLYRRILNLPIWDHHYKLHTLWPRNYDSEGTMRYNFYILFYRSNNPQYIDKLCDPWPNYALHRIAGTNFHQDIEGIQGDISYKCHRLHPRSIHSHIYTNYSQLFCSIRIVNKLHLQNIYHNGQLDTKCSYVSDGNNEKHIHID